MSVKFQPMPLLKRAAPFDDPDWIFELKYDGFRATQIYLDCRSHKPAGSGCMTERRTDHLTRKRVADMSPEEMRRALLVSDKTGLPNKRALHEGEGKPVRSYERRERTKNAE